MVRTHCYNGRESLVTLPGGLRLTPHHPVRKDVFPFPSLFPPSFSFFFFPHQLIPSQDKWQFPLDLVVPHRDTRCDFVYNFVLSGENHAMVVNGIECVTLGHGMEGTNFSIFEYCVIDFRFSDLNCFIFIFLKSKTN